MDRSLEISDLFAKKEDARRFCTLSVDPVTHDIICKVAAATGKSRPSVLAVFVATAHEIFKKEAEQKGISLDGIVVKSVRSRRRGRPRSVNIDKASLEP